MADLKYEVENKMSLEQLNFQESKNYNSGQMDQFRDIGGNLKWLPLAFDEHKIKIK